MRQPLLGFRRTLGHAAALILLSCWLCEPASAQFAPDPEGPTRPVPERPQWVEERSRLRSQVGLDAAEALVGIDDERALQRLGALQGEAALHELVRVADGASSLSDRALVELVHALWRHRNEREAVQALYAVVARSTHDPALNTPSRLRLLAREQAALALATSRLPEAISLLSRMVKRGHDDGALAKSALLAHPPADVAALLATPGAPNVTFVELLEELGDQRAFSELRNLVRRASPEVQARAALALTRLGHLETVPLARQWLKRSQHAAHREAAFSILLQTHDTAVGKVWAERFAKDSASATDAAIAFPQQGIVEAIAALEGAVTQEPRLLMALGYSGGPTALSLLEGELRGPRAATAFYALARCPDPDASAVLERALAGDGLTRRYAAQAAVVRNWLSGQGVDGLGEVLTQLRGSKSLPDRFVGIWGEAVLNPAYAEAQLRSRSKLALSATALAGAVQPPAFFRVAARRLADGNDADSNDRARRELLSVALLHRGGRDRVPSHILADWARRAEPMGNAIRALAERDDARFEAQLEAWLNATDVLTRASAAMGLARNRRPSYTSRLTRAYRYEVDAEVRLALIAALSHRSPDLLLEQALLAASQLDPDARVRAAAQHARLGHEVWLEATGPEVAWILLSEGPPPRRLSLTTPGGFSVEVPTWGQQLVPVLGLRSASVRVRLAPAAEQRNDAPAPDPPSSER